MYERKTSFLSFCVRILLPNMMIAFHFPVADTAPFFDDCNSPFCIMQHFLYPFACWEHLDWFHNFLLWIVPYYLWAYIYLYCALLMLDSFLLGIYTWGWYMVVIPPYIFWNPILISIMTEVIHITTICIRVRVSFLLVTLFFCIRVPFWCHLSPFLSQLKLV